MPETVSIFPATEVTTAALASVVPGQAKVVVEAGAPAAVLGRGSLQDTRTVGKVRLGIPSGLLGVSRGQCTLRISSDTSGGGGGGGGGRVVLETLATAKNPVAVRRAGQKQSLVSPGKNMELRHGDVVEFGESHDRCIILKCNTRH